MATHRVTEAAVWTACAELDAEGKKPTATAVRERIGYGSYQTILRHVATWLERDPEDDEGPVEIPEPPQSFLQQQWATAYTAAWRLLNEEHARLKEDLAQNREQLDALTADADRLQDMLDKCNQARRTEQQGREAADEAAAKAREETAIAKALADERAAQLARIERATAATPSKPSKTASTRATKTASTKAPKTTSTAAQKEETR
jgi:colicin import membrane protein